MSYYPTQLPGGRRAADPDRAAPGSFSNPPYLDYAPPSRSRPESGSLPRPGAERVDAPSRLLAARHHSPPRGVRDDGFPMRPRRLSLDPGDSHSRRPLRPIPPRSPNQGARPVITKGPDRPSSPVSKASRLAGGGVQEVASYLIPASSASGRHRHPSLSYGDRLCTNDRDPRDRTYPGGGSKSSTVRHTREDERNYNYEYTSPKKEFLRDGPSMPLSRARERRASHNTGRERPSSMILSDRAETEYHRNRDAGPPVPNRGYEGLERAESLRLPRRGKENPRESSARTYVRDSTRGERAYDGSRQPPRNPVEDDYIPYPDANSRRSRPRKPHSDDERAETRPRPRKQHPEDENIDPRMDPKSRGHDETYTRGERRRTHHDDREAIRGHDRHKVFDDNADRDHRLREQPLDKRDKGDDDTRKAELVAAGAATAAAAGAAGLAAEAGRRHRHRESAGKDAIIGPAKESRTPHLEPPLDRDSENTSISGDNHPSGSPDDEDRRDKRRRRRREKELEYYEARQQDRRQTEGQPERLLIENEPKGQNASRPLSSSTMVPPESPKNYALREQISYERYPDSERSPREHHRHSHHHHRRHHSHTRDDDSYSSPSSGSSDEYDDDDTNALPREPPRVVTPSNENQYGKPSVPPPPPKGILKKAKDKFPEPPNPVREGVAPLDAAKKGIPPEARWTRINRRLVNPDALTQEGVRFEEYPDYVIVLKVLDQEEINRLAKITHEIREKRRIQMGAAPGTEGEVSDRS